MGELDSTMLEGYLRFNGLMLKGIVGIKRGRALLHYYCSSLPLIFNTPFVNYHIVPSRRGLFLERVANLSKTDSRVWDRLVVVTQEPLLIPVSQSSLPQSPGNEEMNLDEMAQLEVECSMQGDSLYTTLHMI